MKVRISIGNIATKFLNSVSGQVTPLAILNSGAWKKGDLLFGALGGAAELTDKGRRYLQETFQAEEFHKKDARFIVDEEHLEAIMTFFWTRDADYFEIDPRREIIEELTSSEFPSVGQRAAILPILSPKDAGTIEIIHHRTLRQLPPKTGAGTSPLEQKDVPSRRLFHEFMLIGPPETLINILTSPAIISPTPEELASTENGTCKGRTITGFALADNIGLW